MTAKRWVLLGFAIFALGLSWLMLVLHRYAGMAGCAVLGIALVFVLIADWRSNAEGS